MSDEFDKIKIDPPMPKADDLQNVGDGLIDDLLGNTGIFGTKAEIESKPVQESETAQEPVVESASEPVAPSEMQEETETVSGPVHESEIVQEVETISEPTNELEEEEEPVSEFVTESETEEESKPVDELTVTPEIELTPEPVQETEPEITEVESAVQESPESESENILYRELLNGNQEYQVRGVSNSSQVRISDDDWDKNLKISGIIFEDFYERYKAISRGEEIPQVVAVTAILHAAMHSDRPFNSKYPNALRYAHEVLKDYAARIADTDRDLIADFRRTTEEGIYAIESLVLLQFVNQYGADAWLRCRDLLTDGENRDMLRTFRKEIEKYGKAVRLKKLAGSKSVDI